MSRSCARVSTHTHLLRKSALSNNTRHHSSRLVCLCVYVCVPFCRFESLVQHKHSQTRAHEAFGVFISPSSFGLLSPPLPTELTLHVPPVHSAEHLQNAFICPMLICCEYSGNGKID